MRTVRRSHAFRAQFRAVNPTSATVKPLVLEANYAAVREIGRWLDHIIASEGGHRFANRRGEIELAVHELAVNIIDHAFTNETRPNGSLELSADIIDDTLLVRSFDTGVVVEELPDAPNVDTPQVRGYGLVIIRQLAASVHYQRSLSANRWTLSFDAHPAT